MSLSDLKEFSQMVESIYDCALHPQNWQNTTKLICSYVGADAIALDFTDIRLQEPVAGYSHGFSKEFRDLLIRKYAHSWLLQSGFPHWKVGQAMRLHDIVPKDEFENGIFYNEWCKPQGQYDYTGMIAFRDQTRFVKMTNSRHESRNSFSQEDTERLKLLAPHICKSVAISDALDMRAVYARMLETTLDQLTTSVFLIATNGKVSYLNQAAERLLDASSTLKAKGGILTSRCGALERSITQALKFDPLDNGNPKIGQNAIAMPANEGEGLVGLVLPLGSGIRQEFGEATASGVAVFIREPHAPIDFSGAAFSKLYGISPAEMRVAGGLSLRMSLSEISKTLGISLPTVKTHLQHIFEKTHTSKQSDLILLMLNSSPV